MPVIHLTTFIEAPAERVFDLSRNIDLHKLTMIQHREEAVAGTRFGLIEKEETVTWKARHFFKTRVMKVKVTCMEKASNFTDEQFAGPFKKMKHEHFFKACANGTIMIDLFHFESPYGFIGKMLNSIFLNKYMQQLILRRNSMIKEYAESNKWQRLLVK